MFVRNHSIVLLSLLFSCWLATAFVLPNNDKIAHRSDSEINKEEFSGFLDFTRQPTNGNQLRNNSSRFLKEVEDDADIGKIFETSQEHDGLDSSVVFSENRKRRNVQNDLLETRGRPVYRPVKYQKPKPAPYQSKPHPYPAPVYKPAPPPTYKPSPPPIYQPPPIYRPSLAPVYQPIPPPSYIVYPPMAYTVPYTPPVNTTYPPSTTTTTPPPTTTTPPPNITTTLPPNITTTTPPTTTTLPPTCVRIGPTEFLSFMNSTLLNAVNSLNSSMNSTMRFQSSLNDEGRQSNGGINNSVIAVITPESIRNGNCSLSAVLGNSSAFVFLGVNATAPEPSNILLNLPNLTIAILIGDNATLGNCSIRTVPAVMCSGRNGPDGFFRGVTTGLDQLGVIDIMKGSNQMGVLGELGGLGGLAALIALAKPAPAAPPTIVFLPSHKLPNQMPVINVYPDYKPAKPQLPPYHFLHPSLYAPHKPQVNPIYPPQGNPIYPPPPAYPINLPRASPSMDPPMAQPIDLASKISPPVNEITSLAQDLPPGPGGPTNGL